MYLLIRRMHLTATAAAAVLLVSACSVTEYKGEIESFAKAAKTAEETFLKIQNEHAIAHGRVKARNIVTNYETARLTTSDQSKCVMGMPKSCGLFLLNEEGKRESFPPISVGVNGTKLMKAYRVYGERLVALTNAKDAEAVEEAAAGITSAIGGLAKTLSVAGGPGLQAAVATGVGAVEGTVRWVARSYVEQKRYNALRSAVSLAQPFFEVGNARGQVNEQVALFLKGRLLAVEAEILNAKQQLDVTAAIAKQVVEGDESAENASKQLTKWAEAQAIVDRLASLSAQSRAIAADQSSDGKKGVLAKMAKAHAKLVAALNDDKTKAKLVFDAVGDFAEAVDGLAGVVQP